ncbi:MAG: hypothetical protein R3E08_02545 [Thiotrichaceae bacterium]
MAVSILLILFVIFLGIEYLAIRQSQPFHSSLYSVYHKMSLNTIEEIIQDIRQAKWLSHGR